MSCTHSQLASCRRTEVRTSSATRSGRSLIPRRGSTAQRSRETHVWANRSAGESPLLLLEISLTTNDRPESAETNQFHRVETHLRNTPADRVVQIAAAPRPTTMPRALHPG